MARTGSRCFSLASRGVLPPRPPENAAGQDSGELFELFAPPEAMDAPLPLGVAPRPLGRRKPRGQVHRDGDWHSSVHIWLADSDNNLLLQQRSPLKDTHPGMWDVSCAGHITAGDGSLDTAEKELQEELGLSIGQQELSLARRCTFAYCARGSTARHGDFECNEFTDIYLLRVDGIRPEALALEAGEVSAVRLVPAAEVFAAWGGRDPAYVPRTSEYSAVIRQALGW